MNRYKINRREERLNGKVISDKIDIERTIELKAELSNFYNSNITSLTIPTSELPDLMKALTDYESLPLQDQH